MRSALVFLCHDRFGAVLTACERSATHERPMMQIVVSRRMALLILESVFTVREESIGSVSEKENRLLLQVVQDRLHK
jgi:hypothetical protein